MGLLAQEEEKGASGTCLSAVIFVIRRETALYILEMQLFEAAIKIWGLGQKNRLKEVRMGKMGLEPGPGGSWV